MQFSDKLVLLVDDLFSSNASLCISIDNQLIQCISTLVRIGKIKAIFVMDSTSKAENKESIINETNVIDLDSELYQMNVDEKQQLVRKYLEASGIGLVDDDDMACLEKKISHTLLADIVKYNYDNCCIGFPTLVFLFTHINSLRSNGMAFFQFPFDCVRRSIDNLRTSSNETNNIIYSILVSLMLSNERLQTADILTDVRSRFQSRDFDTWDISNILERHDVHYLRSIKANEFRCGLKLYFEFQSKLVHNSVAEIYLNSVLQNHQTDMDLMHNLEIDFIIMFCKPNWYEGKIEEFIVKVDKNLYLPVAEKIINALDAMNSNRYNLYKYLDLISHCSLIEDTELLQTLLHKGDRIIGNGTDHDVDWFPRCISFYLPALMLMYTCNKENAMTVVNGLINYIDRKLSCDEEGQIKVTCEQIIVYAFYKVCAFNNEKALQRIHHVIEKHNINHERHYLFFQKACKNRSGRALKWLSKNYDKDKLLIDISLLNRSCCNPNFDNFKWLIKNIDETAIDFYSLMKKFAERKGDFIGQFIQFLWKNYSENIESDFKKLHPSTCLEFVRRRM